MPTLNAGRSSLSAQRPSPSARRTCGLAFIVLLAGCARAATPAGVVPPEDRVILVVENAHWNDVTVHLLQGSTPRRLGSVRSMSTAELAIPPAYVIGATDITLAVAPLASNESYVLAPIMVYPGSTVRLQAARTLSFSTLELRASARF